MIGGTYVQRMDWSSRSERERQKKNVDQGSNYQSIIYNSKFPLNPALCVLRK